METVLCNNNWMAVSFHLLVSPSTRRSAKRTEEREMGGSDERETTDYVTMEMIVAGKEEDETLGKKFLSLSFVSSSLFPQSTDLSRLTTFFLPSSSVQLTPANFRDNRLNDTAFPFSSKCKTRGMGKREREREMPIFYSWYSKNEKTNRSIEPTYNKQTPFNHNHPAITILLRSNDLILVKQPAKPIHDTFLKTVVSANEKPITVSKTIPCNLQWTNFFPPNCVRIFSSIDLEQSALIDINMYIELINVINVIDLLFTLLEKIDR